MSNPTPPEKTLPSASRPSKPTDETVKETIESIVIAFALAFVFRAYVVEAFVIPTGSMAPTLLGQHLQVGCAQCGYQFSTDASEQALAERAMHLTCPMCFFPNSVTAATRTRSGDRILVQKYAYLLTEPRRWDVVVFKNPRYQSPGPRQNYIKRLVGLPGERVALLDGNVYTSPLGTDDFRIARKTDPKTNRRWRDIQDAVWQPIYHTQYAPLDGGRAGGDRGRRQLWDQPWTPESGDWEITRRRLVLKQPSTDGTGKLSFRFAPPEGSSTGYSMPVARYPYDQSSPGFYDGNQRYWRSMREQRDLHWDAIEDIRLAVTFAPESDATDLRLATTARLETGPVPITLSYTRRGEVQLTAEGKALTPRIQATPLTAGKVRQIEFWHVDQELLVWADGKLMVRHPIDLTWEQVLNRPAPDLLPRIEIEVAGGAATFMDIQLDRDLYYGSFNSGGVNANGGFWRRSTMAHAVGIPVELEANEFFVIGDNAPISDDARYWKKAFGGEDVHPWVERLMFPDDGRSHSGRVPRKLMIGRAFFVYYPAPYPLSPEAPGVFPNFGRMRLIY